MTVSQRVLELFCGIGGVSEAIHQLDCGAFEVNAAIDIDRDCGDVYRHNFAHPVEHRTIESIDFDALQADCNADTWWLSPPCQPYCRRGRGQSESDPRCLAIRSIITWFESRPEQPPSRIGLENVPEFAKSQDCERLSLTLRENGFVIWGGELCPTQFGVPNRRRRYYLVARRDVSQFESPDVSSVRPPLRFSVASILDEEPIPNLWLEQKIATAYQSAIDIVDASDLRAIAACFTSGYGKSIIRSGSYVRVEDRLRRFSPAEVARLLGFSETFSFPLQCSNRQRWKMLGNSLSIPVVKAVMECL